MGFLGSLFNKLTGGIKCPACGMPGAQQEGNRIRCLNPLCQNFDTARGGQAAPPQQPTASQPRTSQPGPSPAAPSSAQGFSSRSAGGAVNISYRNFKGESKNFVADAGSLKRTHNHISARVAPRGKVITLSRDRIQNMHEIDPLLPARDRSDAPQPTARERQVLGYHKKHGTTSPLYEKIRAKYPNW
jgi:hypothetical protein